MVLLLIFSSAILFGAGQQEDAAGEKKVTLTMSFWDQQKEGPYKEIISQFKEGHPNYEIKLRVIPSDNYYNVINTAIQAGEAPDLMYTHGNKNMHLPQMVESGAVIDLTDKIDVRGFPDILVTKTKVNGKIYSSPGGSYDVVPVYYNKAMYDQYGLSEPYTYDDLLVNCSKLKSGGEIPFAMGGKSAWDAFWILNVMITSMSSEWVEDFINGNAKFSDPRYVETHKALVNDIVDNGYLDPNYKGVDGAGARLTFTQGNTAMIVEGSWNAAAMKANPEMNVSCFHWPSREGGNIMLGSQETGFSIYSGTKHEAEALTFLKHLMSKEAFQVLADMGVNVPGLEGVESPDPLIQKMTQYDEVVDQFWNYIVFYTKEGYNAPNDYISYQQEVIYKDMTVDEFVNAIDAEMDY